MAAGQGKRGAAALLHTPPFSEPALQVQHLPLNLRGKLRIMGFKIQSPGQAGRQAGRTLGHSELTWSFGGREVGAKHRGVHESESTILAGGTRELS